MTATPNQEQTDVAEIYEVRLLDGDCAPDAEAPYGVVHRFHVDGPFWWAKQRASDEVSERKLCGAEIYRVNPSTKERTLITSFLGWEE
ncbi:MAG: hypothetical protein ACAH17_03415 [Candidatus Paceibacterota bacterium]